MLESSGGLRIRAYTAGGALPVKGATVRITGADEDNSSVSYSLLTDRDGQTESIILPAPSANYSLAPNPAEFPYSTYDIVITAPGYITKRIRGLTVFSGVNSVQLINMIPGSGDSFDEYPRGNVNSIVPESDLVN
jgi:hypothetical protein